MLFILNKKLEVVDTLSNMGAINNIAPFFEDEYKQILSLGAETYTFKTLANTKESESLIVGNHIAFAYGKEHKLFHITQVEEEHQEELIKTIYCEMTGIELINDIFRPMEILSANVTKFLKTITQDTTWGLGTIDLNITNVADIIITAHTNVYAMLQEHINKTYEAEFSFTVVIRGGRIVRRNINVFKKRGQDKGYRFTYSSNIENVKRTVDSSNLATALIGLGKGDITFKEVEASDKPLGQDFIKDDASFNMWNNNGKHLLGIAKFETDSPHELLRLTRESLKQRRNPQIKYELSVHLLDDDVAIGDTVYVVDHEFKPPLYLSARVGELNTSFSDSDKNTCVLTNFKEVYSKITDEMKDVIEDIVDGGIDNKFPITGEDIEDESLGGNHIVGDSITVDHLTANSITTDKLTANSITTDKLTANSITTEKLQAGCITADKIEAGLIEAIQGSFDNIDANTGFIGNLTSDMATIKDLVSGNISSDNIQTGGITGDRLNMDTIFVKDANIINVNASKVNTGHINTNSVAIKSEDGGIEIVGATQQFKDKNNKIRIQMGKDTKGDFNFILRGEDGTSTLIDHTGIKSQAIADDLIVSNMISSDAIGEKQIDYNSFSQGFNKETNTHTLNATKVRLDNQNQTLDVGFTQLKSQSDDTKSKTESNTTEIKVQQGQIKSVIANTTIEKDGKEILLKDAYNTTVVEVNGMKNTISEQQTTIDESTGKITEVSNKTNVLERNLDSMSSTITSSQQEIAKNKEDIKVNGEVVGVLETEVTTTKNTVSAIEQNVDSISSRVTNTEVTVTKLDGAVGGLDEAVKETKTQVAEVVITNNEIKNRVEEVNTTVDKNQTSVTKSISEIKQTTQTIDLEVSKKTDKDKVISSINMSPESIKIAAAKLTLTGLVNFENLTDGKTTISGNNIKTGTLNAINITGCNLNGSNIQGTEMLYMAKNGIASFDGRTFIKNLHVVGNHEGWEGEVGNFYCSSRAVFEGYETNILSSNTNIRNIYIEPNGSFSCDVPRMYTKDIMCSSTLYLDGTDRYVSVSDGKDISLAALNGNINLKPSGNYGHLVIEKRGYLWPHNTMGYSLGADGNRFSTVFCGSVNQSSDLKTKENIKYLSDNTKKHNNFDSIDLKDCYNFIKDDYKPTIYDYKINFERDSEELKNQIGFIAQDICNTKVAKYFLKGNENDGYSYNLSSYVGLAMAGLKESTKKIEILENENKELKDRLKLIEEKLGLIK